MSSRLVNQKTKTYLLFSTAYNSPFNLSTCFSSFQFLKYCTYVPLPCSFLQTVETLTGRDVSRDPGPDSPTAIRHTHMQQPLRVAPAAEQPPAFSRRSVEEKNIAKVQLALLVEIAVDSEPDAAAAHAPVHTHVALPLATLSAVPARDSEDAATVVVADAPADPPPVGLGDDLAVPTVPAAATAPVPVLAHVAFPAAAPVAEIEQIEVTLLGKESRIFNFALLESIENVRRAIADILGQQVNGDVDPNQLRLMFAHTELKDSHTLASYGIFRQSRIRVLLRIPGGAKVCVSCD
jgi:hypothetical protein